MSPGRGYLTIGATCAALSLGSILSTACGGDSGGPSGNRPPAVTPPGTPTGPVVTATIGPAGGSLQSDDGLVRLEVPAGALAADASIGLQRISARAPGAVGEAIRLTPDGLQFSTPVTLHFAYDSQMVEGSAPALMTIVTQQDDGSWLLLGEDQVVRDTLNRRFVVTTTHFSDYSRLQGFQIRPPSGEIDPGASIGLTIKDCTTIVDQSTGTTSAYAVECENAPTVNAPDDDPLAPLPTFRGDPASWAANGVRGGNASVGFVGGDGNSAEFLAPQAPPAANPVAVSVRVRDARDRTVSTLVANIKIRNSCGPSLRAGAGVLLRDVCAPPVFQGFSRSIVDDAHPLYRIEATVTWVYDTAGSVPGTVASYKAIGTTTFTAINTCIQISPSQHSWQLNDPQSGGTLTLSLPDSTWTGVGISLWQATYTDTCDPNSTPSQAAAGGAWFGGSGGFTSDLVIAGTQPVGGQTFTFDFSPNFPVLGRAPRPHALRPRP
ncbi:MAG: hypothetical protein U0133_04990 [Gemmatimonadales bacterium]